MIPYKGHIQSHDEEFVVDGRCLLDKFICIRCKLKPSLFFFFPLLKCNCCSFIIVEFMTDRAAAD